jgi:Fe-S cluster assembly ATP-binding protein
MLIITLRRHLFMGEVLEIRDLRVNVEGKEILRGVNLTVEQGEVHALMGPNGSGKSTLAYSIMGHPGYEVVGGEVIWKDQNILELAPDERSRLGLFLAFQYPVSIPGVTVANFLRTAINARLKAQEPDGAHGPLVASGATGRTKGISIPEFRKLMMSKMKMLGMDPAFAGRYLNEGFSGGEKKRNEILQMAMLEPQIAILDETDSGLDIDALKIVAEGVNRLLGPNMGALVITHYQRLLDYIKPQRISILFEGRVVVTGGAELALELERTGYESIRAQFGDKIMA